MSEKKLPPQFLGLVQLQSALMGLTLAFKQKYGEEALKVTEAFGEQLGIRIGTQIKEEAGIEGSGLRDIERVFHLWTDPSTVGPPSKTKVEGKKLTLTRESPAHCPAIHVAKQINLPLEMVCNTLSFPMLRGVAKAVNPEAKHTSVQISEQKCVDFIEIP